jgi:arylsulfatase A-like enzyme
MDRRTFIKTGSAAISSYPLWNVLSACTKKTKNRPNIVFILADDLGYGDLSCYGQKYFQTPHIDQLAETGMRFTQHYAGSPVCAPSRCVLMTGKHTGHAWVRGNKQAEPSGQLPLPENEVTFARLLQSSGYKTGCFGKWGLGIAGSSGDPQKHGFDEFFGYYDQVLAHNSFPEYLYRNGEKVDLDNEVHYLDESHWSRGLGSYSTVKRDYSNDLIFEEALGFLEKNRENPFFLYFPTTIPHDNGEAPEGERFEVPELGKFKDRDWSGEEKAYAAMVRRLDMYVGKIEEKLRELNLEQNTMIVFTSDNGAVHPDTFENRFGSNGTLRGYKRDLYEGGIRVPLIIKWPAVIEGGQTSGHISAFWDFFPTLCDVAGIQSTHETDGISFLPELRGKNQPEHEYLYWEFHWWKPSKRALRMGKWKAVQNAPESEIELYDLSEDIREENDLAGLNPGIVEQAQQLFENARTPSQHFEMKA